MKRLSRWVSFGASEGLLFLTALILYEFMLGVLTDYVKSAIVRGGNDANAASNVSGLLGIYSFALYTIVVVLNVALMRGAKFKRVAWATALAVVVTAGAMLAWELNGLWNYPGFSLSIGSFLMLSALFVIYIGVNPATYLIVNAVILGVASVIFNLLFKVK
jgi:hypothetical protein